MMLLGIYVQIKNYSQLTHLLRMKKMVYLGNSRTTNVLGKGKVLKLTSSKMLALNEVLHVPNIKENLVYVALLGNFNIKMSFESDKIVMTKNNIFVGEMIL